METPDVTKAQIIALAQAALATIVAFGVNLSFKQQAVLMGDSAILAGLIVSADVAIRRGRQKHFGASFRLADVADALAKTREIAPPVERLRAAVDDAGLTHAAAVDANGPQAEPGTYPAEGPAVETPPEASAPAAEPQQPQQPAF